MAGKVNKDSMYTSELLGPGTEAGLVSASGGWGMWGRVGGGWSMVVWYCSGVMLELCSVRVWLVVSYDWGKV